MSDLKQIEMRLIERELGAAPSRRIVDLGCGDGKHAKLLGERGYEVVGIDASDAAIERAKEPPVPDGVEFQLGDMGAVEGAVRGHFGAALCVGNTLPYLLTPDSASRMFLGLKRRLLPGAPLVIQILNYDRIVANHERALPVEVYPSPDGDLVVLRLVQARDDGIVLHNTTTLRHRAAASPSVEIVGSHQTQLRGWKKDELEIMLGVAQFKTREFYGDMKGSEYHAEASPELVVVAR